MITEDYVSFETAKLLKEKGFDEECYGYYDTTKHPDYMLEHSGSEMDSNDGPDCYISAPTLQMAMKWLRENYVMHIDVRVTNHSISDLIDIVKYYWVGYNSKTARWVNESTIYKVQGFDTYEEACDDAIRTCLKNIK